MPNANHVKLLSLTLARLAEINGAYFRDNGELPAALVIAPSPNKANAIDLMPLEALVMPETRNAIRDAALTVTCIEGYIAEQRTDAPMPDSDTIADHPDARHCYVYFAQARDGTAVCAVQYVLKSEHSRAQLSPLKVLSAHPVAMMNPTITEMTRPGRSLQ